MIRYGFKSFDGKELSVCEWNDVQSPKGVVNVSHGMAEHALRYERFAEYMNGMGYIVVVHDLRAHGETSPELLGYESGFNFGDSVRDMHEISLMLKEKYNLPVVLFGHSYGSFLATAYVEEYSSDICGAVIGGSSYMGGGLVAFAGLIAKIGCAFKGEKKPAVMLKKLTFDSYEKKLGGSSFISSIPEEAERYNADEKCGFICSYNFYRGMFKGLSGLYKKKKLYGISVPVLLISGCNDPVGNFAKGVEKLEDAMIDCDVKVKLVLQEGVRHEYLNDIKAEEARKAISDFADDCLENVQSEK
ncbi:MAG: alpha/beta hydrolase [Clostridia bacterium]|nr:alpha/beta hydrolase [Clostridia bacterium]